MSAQFHPMPHSVEAEQAVIGGLLLDNTALSDVREVLRSSDFYRADHQRIYRGIVALSDAGSPFDAVTLAEHLDRMGELDRVGGIGYLGTVAEHTPSAANVGHYAAIVKDRAERRRLVSTAEGIRERASTAPLEELQAEMLQAAESVRRKPRRLPLLTFEELSVLPPMRQCIKGVLPAAGVAGIWGPSTSGKTFLALHQAAHLAAGRDWFGYRIPSPLPVAYCGLEGEHGIPNRATALAARFGALGNMRFLLRPFDLLKDVELEALIAALLGAGVRGGVVYVDTLARAAQGDENSAEYGAAVLASCKRLQDALEGLVVLVHHTGKDASKGLRGHSSLFAGLDAGIEVTRDHSGRSWRVAKAKDGSDDATHAFKLEVVELGIDQEGDPLTSCVVVPAETTTGNVSRSKPPAGGNQKIVWDALGELFKESTHHGKGGAPATRAAIRLEDAVSKTRTRLPCPTDRQTERTRQAITGLISRGNLAHEDGWIWCL
jgi:hypothetical protein